MARFEPEKVAPIDRNHWHKSNRYIQRRIEAHVCICFVAYKIYKELERRLKINGIDLSVDRVLDIAKTITTLKIKLPKSRETISKTMLITSKYKLIAPLFEEKFWKDI